MADLYQAQLQNWQDFTNQLVAQAPVTGVVFALSGGYL
ncbi:hypothetical protein EUX98_g6652 [Antrodiella citrinella]|uniref:Uncharacterized protein n=1 Tax=Antrodiella citrinella TaxID=2447956 RepID=A0A4S4MVY8_9APHY|nr:hypothetical protein EUX98_g6652 [Antrodiella citrinella]